MSWLSCIFHWHEQCMGREASGVCSGKLHLNIWCSDRLPSQPRLARLDICIHIHIHVLYICINMCIYKVYVWSIFAYWNAIKVGQDVREELQQDSCGTAGGRGQRGAAAPSGKWRVLSFLPYHTNTCKQTFHICHHLLSTFASSVFPTCCPSSPTTLNTHVHTPHHPTPLARPHRCTALGQGAAPPPYASCRYRFMHTTLALHR